MSQFVDENGYVKIGSITKKVIETGVQVVTLGIVKEVRCQGCTKRSENLDRWIKIRSGKTS